MYVPMSVTVQKCIIFIAVVDHYQLNYAHVHASALHVPTCCMFDDLYLAHGSLVSTQHTHHCARLVYPSFFYNISVAEAAWKIRYII